MGKTSLSFICIRSKNRDKLQKYLKDNDISSGIHYPIALPKLKAYDYIGQKNELLFANRSDKELLSLPIGDHLSKDDLNHIINIIKSFV